jgi:hypothetical protein
MLPPGMKRIICIDVTNRCSIMRCSNCTRGLIYQNKRWDMRPENFREAVRSLRDWTELLPVWDQPIANGHRVIAMIGGNPCMSPHFEAYCQILKEEIPRKEARGLWTEKFNGFGPLIRETFGFFNLNVHDNDEAAEEMRRELPGTGNYIQGAGHRSVHGGLFTAIQDFVGTPEIPDRAAMWRMIGNCEVNLHWSGTIMPFDLPDGSQVIRAYFCEIAGVLERIAASRAEAEGQASWGPTHGLPVTPGWWKQGMNDLAFDRQMREWCPKCGVAMKIRGHEDLEFTDDFSPTHEGMVQLAIKRKQGYKLHGSPPAERSTLWTDYQRNLTASEPVAK